MPLLREGFAPLHKEKTMEYILAAYRSRNVAIQAYNYLTGKGVTCALVSTPRAAGVGCGLSVKFATSYFEAVRSVLTVETFAGFFLYRATATGGTLVRL